MPKKDRIAETPKRGGEKKRTRLDTSRRTPTKPREEELARTAAQKQTDKVQQQKRKDDLIDKIREEQLKARMAKMAHTSYKPPGEPRLTTRQIAKFTAINENWTQDTPNKDGRTEESDTEVCVGNVAGVEEGMKEADEDPKEATSESDPEFLRGEDYVEDSELDPAFESSGHEYEENSPSPERDVVFSPEKPITKTSRKNARRRKNLKAHKAREEEQDYEETKKRIGFDRRIGRNKKNPHLRLGPPTNNQRRPPTSSTEILSDSDARAGRRPDSNREEKKRRRESQDSVEEIDSQGRKLPRSTNKHQRN